MYRSCCLLAVACLVAPAFAERAEKPRFSDLVEVDVVTVDVVVTGRDGVPVRGLARDLFTILEDGEEVELTNFVEVRALEPAAGDTTRERVASPPAEPLHLVVYVDTVFSRTAGLRETIPAVEDLVRDQLPPGCRVMVATYDGMVHVPVPFTEDVGSVVEALEPLRRAAGNAAFLDAHKDMYLDRLLEPAESDGAEAFSEDDVVRWVRNGLEAVAAETRYLARGSLLGLRSVVDSLVAVRGRKVLLYVSDGLPASAFGRVERTPDLLLQSGGSRSTGVPRELKEVALAAGTAGVTVYGVNARGLSRRLATGVTAETSGRAGFAGMTVDARRSRALAEEQDSLDSMLVMADVTGGDLVLDPGRELADLGDSLGSYYSLGYQSRHGTDGERHRIEVRVEGKGLTARHRTRYQALTARDRAAGRALAALVYEPIENPLGVGLQLTAAPKRSHGSFDLPLMVVVPTERLGLTPAGRQWRGQVRVFLVAQDLHAELSPLVESVLEIAIPEDRIGDHPALGHPVFLPVEPGRHRIAVTVLDEGSGTISSAVATLVVDEAGGVWAVDES